jgi:hypothetical protein
VRLDELMKAIVAEGAAHVICMTTYAKVFNHQTSISFNVVKNLSKLIQVTAAGC